MIDELIQLSSMLSGINISNSSISELCITSTLVNNLLSIWKASIFLSYYSYAIMNQMGGGGGLKPAEPPAGYRPDQRLEGTGRD